MKNLLPMKPALHFITALLFAPLATLHAAEPKPATLHPYVTAGDPNIGRAFRIASGDLVSNILPLTAPYSPKKWKDLSGRLAEIAGTADVIPERVAFLTGGMDYPGNFAAGHHCRACVP